MTEVIFPLFGAAFVVLLVLPVFGLLAKAGLVLLECDRAGGPLRRLHLRYLLLTGSSFFPLIWFFSAGLHQAENGTAGLACLFAHNAATFCIEPGFFALILGFVILAYVKSVFRGMRSTRLSRSVHANDLTVRIERILDNHSMLCSLRGRVVVTDEPGFALGTHGWIKPRVFIGVAFAARLSDDMLASALGHEMEHVRVLDPLRYLLLQLALAVNPLGRFLLKPHADRWLVAREAHCDREAVIRGSLPLSLADAIVQAARPSSFEVAALGAQDTAVLKFRIGMLLAFAERKPGPCCRSGLSAFPVVSICLLLSTLLLPHQIGAAVLDAVHTSVEHALTYFLL